MKKIIIFCIGFVALSLNFGLFALEVPGPNSTIFNEDLKDALNSENINDPIRGGSYLIINNEEVRGDGEELSVKGVVDAGVIKDHKEAKGGVLNIIKNMTNYLLGILGLVALIYLLYHGFIMVTAAGDEEKYKQGLKGIKYAAIALAGIGLSFFVISLVFYIIDLVT